MSIVNLEMRCSELGLTLKEGVSICKRFGVPKRVIGKGVNLKYLVDSGELDSGIKKSMNLFKQSHKSKKVVVSKKK